MCSYSFQDARIKQCRHEKSSLQPSGRSKEASRKSARPPISEEATNINTTQINRQKV